MRIALVTFRFPHPLFGGGSSRAFHQMEELRRRGHLVRLVTPPPLPPAAAEVEAAVRPLCEKVVYYRTGGLQSAASALAAPFMPRPLQTSLQWSGSGRRALASVLADGRVDVLHAQLIRTAPAVRSAPLRLGRVLDLIDALSLNLTRRATEEPAPLSWLLAHEASRVRRYEHAVLRAYDEVLICSAFDRAAIGDPRIVVAPMGVDLPAMPREESEIVADRVVFTGAMWYFPNENAVRWFAAEIWPRVRARVPRATFIIVGDRPTAAVRRLADLPGITVTGHVPSVERVLRTASVVVAPMQAGSGMQTKVLSAMAHDVPVVATSYVLCGIPATPGEHLAVADSPETFASELVDLMQDGGRRARLASAARQFVTEHYSWRHSVDLLEAAYERACEAGSRRVADSRIPVEA